MVSFFEQVYRYRLDPLFIKFVTLLYAANYAEQGSFF